MNIFVLNCGSSSVKFQIINTDLDLFETDSDHMVAKGLIEKVGSKEAIYTFESAGNMPVKGVEPIADHREAIIKIKKWMEALGTQIEGIKSFDDIHAVGHRVVHGAEKFAKSVLIGDEVIKQLEECCDLAPLHNPANLKGIAAITEIFGDKIPQVGVFDTAFHSTMPEEAYMYAIPYDYYQKYRIRAYGFHGTSHRYVAYRYRKINNLPKEKVNVIILHLGNGCSITSVKNGESVFNSMGMTPIEGLIMGTRCGDIDTGIVEYLLKKGIGSFADIMNILQKKSGMLGVSGISNDMRDLVESGEPAARLAVDYFVYQAAKQVGALAAVLGGVDALVFTAGIGERSADIRRRICEASAWLGVTLDPTANAGHGPRITTARSRVSAWVIPTNEELMIARHTSALLGLSGRRA